MRKRQYLRRAQSLKRADLLLANFGVFGREAIETLRYSPEPDCDDRCWRSILFRQVEISAETKALRF